MTDLRYSGDVKVGGGPGCPRARAPDDHQGGGGRADVQQRLPAPLPRTGDQVLIDAAAEPETLLPLIGDAGLTSVVTTHQHWDHHRALGAVSTRTRRHVAGVEDANANTTQTGVPIARAVTDGHTVEVGDCTLEVIASPATPPAPSRCSTTTRVERPPAPVHRRLAVPRWRRQHLRRRLGVPAAHRRRRDQALRPAPDETWFYPGHGDDSTFGVERPHLAEWRERGW